MSAAEASIGRSVIVIAPIVCGAVALTGGARSPLITSIAASVMVSSLAPVPARVLGVLRVAVSLFVAVIVAIDVASSPSPIDRFGLAVAAAVTFVLGSVGVRAVRRALDHALHSAREAQRRAVVAARARQEALVAASAAFAHELKNPLAAVQGLSSLILRRVSKTGAASRDDVDRLASEAQRASTIVRELLDFTRPVGPRGLRRVSVTELIDGALGEANVELVVESEAPSVVVESERATRALASLLQLTRRASVSAVDDERARLQLEGRFGEQPGDIALARALLDQVGVDVARPGPDRLLLTFGPPMDASVTSVPVVVRVAPFVWRARVVVLVAATTFTLYSLVTASPGSPHIWFSVLPWLGVVVLTWLDWKAGTRDVRVVFIGSLTILLASGTLLSGGLASPFLVGLPAVTTAAAVIIPERRTFAIYAVISASALAISIVLEILAPEVIRWPPLDRSIAGAPHFAATLMMTIAVVRGVMSGSEFSGELRAALDEARALELAAAEEKAEGYEERTRAIGLLAARLASDLQAPLDRIDRLAQALAASSTDETTTSQYGVLIAEVARMRTLLDMYASFGGEALHLDEVDLRELAQRIAEAEAGIAQPRDVKIVVSGGARVVADREMLRHALSNLLRNAVEASPDGATVSVTVREEDAWAIAYVDDEGPGVPEAWSGRLFAPGATSKPAGSGLGLVIARRVVARHGGEVTLENREPRGARATLSLPVAAPRLHVGRA